MRATIMYGAHSVLECVGTEQATHIAIQNALDGKVVEWMKKVTDEQYEG